MYDYIVVGAGSSGGVLANRLSESGGETVCLLEAGPPAKSALISTPGAFAVLVQDFKQNIYNWRFNTRPDSAMNNRSQYQPRGRGLGGSSSINGMVYIRGDRADYDHWASLGNRGWSYQDLLPFFRKAESNERGANAYHGDSGPLNVSNGKLEFDMYHAFMKSALDLGYPYNPDFNGEKQEGVGVYQFTVKDGKRAGVRASYIVPAMERPNLTIETGAHASRLLFEGKRAVGVEFIRNGERQTIRANKEVIVSSGSFNSPQLLLLSGIGPEAELKAQGISPLHHLPGVGKNLQEHPDIMLVYKSRKKSGISASLLGTVKTSMELIRYIGRRTGWLACPPTAVGGFFKTSPELSHPDFQVHFVPMPYRDHARDLRMMMNWGFSLLVNVSRPKSRGQVTLKDADPLSPPDIQLNLLSEKDDLVRLRNAVKLTREIVEGNAMDEYRDIQLSPEGYLKSDDEIDDFLRKEGAHAYHPVGTCKMGSDDMAVVDDRLRVHGMAGLRVVDCSIMPTLVGGNTNAAAIMIGEKAADMIRQDNAAQTSQQKSRQTDRASAVPA